MLNLGNFLDTVKSASVKVPSPGPSSIILIFLGFPKISQADTNQTEIISENKLEIFGDVMKSPFWPKGYLVV